MYSNLDISIKKALEQRVDSNCELLVTCFAHTSLHNVIELFVSHEAHRLIIIDESDKVIGIICLSDVLAFLITEHNELGELHEERDEEGESADGKERGPLERSVSNKVNVSDKVLERINELSEQKRLGEERRPREYSVEAERRIELDRRKASGREEVGGGGKSSAAEGTKVSDRVREPLESRSSGELSRGSRQFSAEQSSESDCKRDEPDDLNEDKNGEEFTV